MSNSNPTKERLRDLVKKLQALPHLRRLAFAAACCERAYPNYLRFFQLAHWGAPAILRTSLDRVWDAIMNTSIVEEEIRELEEKCEAATPDLDDFSSADIDVEAAAAQEAAFMVRLLLQFCKDNQVSYALRIVTFATDTIDLYVQVVENFGPADPQLNERVASHPLMLREISEQEDDLLRLANIQSRADLQEFRHRVMHLEKSNIGFKYTVE